MKTLVFDVFGDLGHFRKFYTTSSPLTYAFPPPPTVRGMLGAITGCDKSEYLDVFSHEICKIAIRLLSPVKKIRMGLNYLNTKGNYWVPIKKKNHEARTQICVEFVKEPQYRFYVAHSDQNVFNELECKIKQGKTVFTLSLGLSELLAGFRYRGTFHYREMADVREEIVSVVPISRIKEYGTVIEEGKKYFKEKLAIEMDSKRVVGCYGDVLFEAQGRPILTRVKRCWKGEDGSVTFF